MMDDDQRDRLASNVVGHLGQDVSKTVLERALWYWRNTDKGIGDRIAQGVIPEQ
jgi:catalase